MGTRNGETKIKGLNMKYKEWDCAVELTHYTNNGQPAILLNDIDDGTPIAKATTCIDYDFQENETAIKSWSENEGMLAALITGGLVSDTGKRVPCGFVEAAIVKIL